jgi:hypothetical protein
MGTILRYGDPPGKRFGSGQKLRYYEYAARSNRAIRTALVRSGN